MWALDFQFDLTVDGRQVRFPNVVDEFTREALAVKAFRSCTADAPIGVLDEIIAATGRKPEHIRMDNGTEMTAHAMTDWCRFTGVDAPFIDPGPPWQNGICESSIGRFRDEFLTCEIFHSLTEVQVLAEDWRFEYNNYRPHGSLGFLSPHRIPPAMVTDRVQPTTTTHMIGGPENGAQSIAGIALTIGRSASASLVLAAEIPTDSGIPRGRTARGSSSRACRDQPGSGRSKVPLFHPDTRRVDDRSRPVDQACAAQLIQHDAGDCPRFG